LSSAREEILARIRAANAAAGIGGTDGSAKADAAYAAIPRDYLRSHHDPARTDIVALFAERAADYQAVVERVPAAGVAGAVRLAAGVVSGTMVIPPGVPAEWVTGLGDVTGDDPPLSAAELDQAGGVITGCAVAIAETGTVVLDHGPRQGRRALTLLPDFHLVIVSASQVAADLADALSRLDPSRPLTFISGPSATSDIELIRVEGVHGPRRLHIVIAG
jgi:L-lactate dehydrogenase complex protein LldG